MRIFRLPDVGEGLAEASIVQWHVAPGDDVAADQILVSVETAKAVVDIPSPRAGRIAALLAQAGETVATEAPLVEFTEGEEESTGADREDASEDSSQDNGTVVGQLSQQQVVRRENFIIGRHRHTEARMQQSQQRRSQRRHATAPAAFDGGEDLDITRRAMADNMARAHREVALVTLTLEAEITFADRRLLTARLVRALVAGVRAEPALNAWYDGDAQKRRLHEAVHVGVAVDTAHGLFVPVLQDAQGLEPMQIAR
ncbi:MAG TPA: 2-oxo acid dehydrogenase subunit E2, partial [Moraxellaceae bacterium]